MPIFRFPQVNILRDQQGQPVYRGRIFFYRTGSTIPRQVYSDPALTVPLAQPIVADDMGRLPDIYVPDTNYRVNAQYPDCDGRYLRVAGYPIDPISSDYDLCVLERREIRDGDSIVVVNKNLVDDDPCNLGCGTDVPPACDEALVAASTFLRASDLEGGEPDEYLTPDADGNLIWKPLPDDSNSTILDIGEPEAGQIPRVIVDGDNNVSVEWVTQGANTTLLDIGTPAVGQVPQVISDGGDGFTIEWVDLPDGDGGATTNLLGEDNFFAHNEVTQGNEATLPGDDTQKWGYIVSGGGPRGTTNGLRTGVAPGGQVFDSDSTAEDSAGMIVTAWRLV